MADREHWDSTHAGRDVDGVSWWQPRDSVWSDLVVGLDLPPGAVVADVGSGSSTLVDALLDDGRFTVLAIDLSGVALSRVAERVGPHPRLTLLEGDVRDMSLPSAVEVWHDRAVFHFLTEESDRAAYRAAMRRALAPGGHVIVATFAPDGPETCSGLPVCRYDASALVSALGLSPAEVVDQQRRVHVTPWGSEQPFTVVIARPATR